ncbi:MAG: GH3 auxin-responsive promoter family protein, partial [Duncaniella sp.]|nr:GH3 auxin-responsive promoter family protein [Duncaniella sp.]
MIDFTPIARTVISRRARTLRENAMHLREVQSRWLEKLISRGRKTEWGERHNFDKVKDYESFVEAHPEIVSYPDIRAEVMRMVNGERDILWPGRTRNFAQSSGTSDGKSKYIPITPDSFHYSHYRGGADVVALYLDLVPDSRIFSGKSFILGGSFANELDLPKGVCVGDLSANLIQNINPIVNFFRTPYKKIALLTDWYEKLPALVDVAV